MVPGGTAEASLYRPKGPYGGRWSRAGRNDGRTLSPQQSGIGSLVPRLSPIVVWPCRPPWLCRLEYLICQGQIPRCVDRCLSSNLYRCAFAPDPQVCEAQVWQLCTGQCQVACDAAYARCLQCR